MHLNTHILESFMQTHFGYGSLEADYWFVGVEESGGADFDQLARRLALWREMGENTVSDLAEFYVRLRLREYFSIPVKPHASWMQIARMVLAAQGQATSNADVQTYQREHLGRAGHETCLLELFPLPVPNSTSWFFDRWSTLPLLKSKAKYKNAYQEPRMEQLRQLVETYQPKVVVFTSDKLKPIWQQKAGTEFEFKEEYGVWLGRSGATLFLVTQSPTQSGITNAYFENAGGLIAGHLAG